MNQEDWNAEMGDEASPILPPLEQASFPERPNGPSSDFSPSMGLFGAAERPNTSQPMQNHFGGFSRSRGFQERKVVEDSSTQNRGFKEFPGGFGRSETVYKECNEEIGSERGPKVTYVPPPPPDDEQAIFARYQTGINFDKYDENVVEVSGLDPPAPLLAFEEANLSQTLNMNIAKAGYSKLTPVQKYSIPIIMAGRDLMACAQTGSGKTIGLHNVKYLVLDEADRMLDMGFGLDMKKLISYPSMPPKDKRQTLMFSATFPEEVQRLAGEFLKTHYLFVVVGHVGGACSDVQQNILQVPQYSKRDKLIEILQSIGHERTMVFVDKKKKADYIAAFLCQEKISATSIHGDREQREREVALQDFRSGKCPVLVATSVAARGLDIENVQHVINFDLPSTIEEYVHRIGRTGRCGNTGKAVCFFDNSTDSHLAQSLVKVLSDAQQEVPVWLEEIAFGFQGERVFTSVNTQKNYGGRGNVNPGGMKMSYSANAFESWD
ncbi:probable ATP-dependent RNA helicase DDX4 [Grus japonensis]|uniref:RNA helicase n=1 Tax=Grus japonensis TaxID=30415 RepID=A0ABC9Y339_GRUJA